jgi:hypothetical protein
MLLGQILSVVGVLLILILAHELEHIQESLRDLPDLSPYHFCLHWQFDILRWHY